MRVSQVIFTMALIASPQLSMALDEYVWESSCDSGQSSMNGCAVKKYELYDEQLNNLYKQKISTMEDRESKGRLKNSQRKWIAYRDAECLFSAGPYDPYASIWTLHQYLCLAELTRERAQRLETWVNCTDNGCP